MKLKTLLIASVATATMATAATPVMAEGKFLGGDLSANVSLVSDYRFRGASFSDNDIALQGGLDYSHESGFYFGVWGSSLDEGGAPAFGELEVDVYGGYSTEIEGIALDVGLLLYAFPTGNVIPEPATDYLELYGSVGVDLGVASATFGAAYAFSNDALGNDDNIYLYTDIGADIPDTPISVGAHLGYSDGSLGDLDGDGDASYLDWSVSASVAYEGLDFTVSYIDTNLMETPSTDGTGDLFGATVVFSVGASF